MTAGAVGLKDMVFPLTAGQKATFKLYTSDAALSKIARYWNFYMQDQEARKQLIWESTQIGCITGGIVGVISAFFILTQDDDDGEEKRARAVKIAQYSILGGGFLGAFCGAGYKVALETPQSTSYGNWRKEAIEKKIFPLFKKFLRTSKELQEFTCLFSQDLVEVPVRDPKGRLYERASIEKWIDMVSAAPLPHPSTLHSDADRERVRCRTSPFCDIDLKKTDLAYDFDYHANVAIIIKKLFDQQLEEQFRSGLLQYRLSITKSREDLMKDVSKVITDKYMEGQVTQKEFLDLTEACKNHYSLSAI